jgi:hypothetical protein
MNWDGIKPFSDRLGSGKRVGINVRGRGEGFSPEPVQRQPLEKIPEGPDFFKINQCDG